MNEELHSWTFKFHKVSRQQIWGEIRDLFQLLLQFFLKCKSERILTRNVLDWDQSNYSSRIIFSYTFTLEPNTNWIGIGWTVSEIWSFKVIQDGWRPRSWIWSKRSTDIRSADPKPYHRTKREVNRMTRCRNMAIRHFPRWRPAAILDFLQPEVVPCHSIRRPRKSQPRTKHEADRMSPCRDMAVWNFPRCEVGRRSVGLHWCHVETYRAWSKMAYICQSYHKHENETIFGQQYIISRLQVEGKLHTFSTYKKIQLRFRNQTLHAPSLHGT